MYNLLHSQIENERAILNKLKEKNRKDLIAQMLIERVEREIKTLERKLHVSEGKKNVKHGYRRGIVQRFCEIMHRTRDIKNASNSPVYPISETTITTSKAVVK